MPPRFPQLALLLGALLLLGSSLRAQEDAPALFEHPAADAPRLRREALDAALPGGALRLNLRPGPAAALTARVTRVGVTALGSRVVHARIEGQPGGALVLARHGDAVAGGVWISLTERYAVDAGSLRAVDASSPARCACALDGATPRRAVRAAARPAAEPVTSLQGFDVLIVYTPAALRAEGSVDALTAQAEAAMADANACYLNSGIPIQGKIVGVRAVNYAESGEIRTDLHRLAFPDDGSLDEVQGYRDGAQADLVAMFTRRDSADGYQGYAEILTGLTPDAEILGFSVVDVKAATVEHLFAHERGHNMGCDHDRENTTGLRLFDYSYGWRFTGQDGKLYRDVLAYAPGVSVPYFANPAVSYLGTPTGVAGYADTARTLTGSAPAFVNFRAADGRGRVSVAASVAEASVDSRGAARAAFAFERTGGVAQALSVACQVGGTALAGVNYKALKGTLVFDAGSHFASLGVKGKAGTPPFGAGTVTLALLPGDGYVPADSPTGGGGTAASATLYDRLPLVSLGGARRVGSAPGKPKFRVGRLGRLDAPLTIHYSVGGTAAPGTDYAAPSGTVTIPAGADHAGIGVRLLGGAGTDGGKTVEITLQPDAAYNVGAAGTATGAL